jgi:peroxiredoxin family protein
MPDLDLVEADFEEAAAMLNKFPRGATALIHVCIEKLMPLLKKAGKDEDISSLVRKGLEVEIHQTMEALQVLRKSPVQLTQFNSQEDRETALRFFDSLKEILERRMLKNPNEN